MSTNSKSESKAIAACRHILHRIATSSDFAWYMNFTESQSLCVQAIAEHDGVCFNSLDKIVKESAAKAIKQEQPRVELLRVRIEELEAQNEAADDFKDELRKEAESSSVKFRLEELLHYCRIRGEHPTVEAIESALQGKALAACLGCMKELT